MGGKEVKRRNDMRKCPSKETNHGIQKQQEKPLSLFIKISMLLAGLAGLIAIGIIIVIIFAITVGGDRYYTLKARKEYIENIDKHSKAEFLQFIRDGEEYVIKHPGDEESRKLLEEAKKKWADKMLKEKPQ